ncbi:hypothetical protein RF11_01072 [Thelohanellus kitauei]|uniref:VWFA domain-containing protein n=1 Tax=Thelohanellus kitauei TaxID=669202 RepID=A0A0C2N4A8_THEKT|nr:hypothetical protein RF11_01072 [Thelohanellus kitauei]
MEPSYKEIKNVIHKLLIDFTKNDNQVGLGTFSGKQIGDLGEQKIDHSLNNSKCCSGGASYHNYLSLTNNTEKIQIGWRDSKISQKIIVVITDSRIEKAGNGYVLSDMISDTWTISVNRRREMLLRFDYFSITKLRAALKMNNIKLLFLTNGHYEEFDVGFSDKLGNKCDS